MKSNPTQNLSNVNQYSSDADAVTVSDVIGDGPSAHRIVRVGAWALVAPVDDPIAEQALIADRDLAGALGHARERDVRKLIERWEPEIGPILSRVTMARGLFRGKTQGSAPVKEYLLTEQQALFVAAKSETKKATALLKEIVRVYVAVRKHMLGAHVAPLQTAIDQQRALIVAQSHDLDMVRAENRTLREQQTNGTIPHASADWIRDQIAIIAPMMVALGWCPRKQTLRAAKRVLQNGIASAAGWGHEKGQEIAGMPIAGFPHVRAYLRAQRTVMEAELARRHRAQKTATQAIMLARQGNLFGDQNANQNACRAVS